MTKILVLDTSTENCSVALQVGEHVSQISEVCPRMHSQKILPMVDQLLADAQVSLSQLDCIGYGHGPGSFTGVRISVSMMQGLALGADLPVVGVSTLATMAQAAVTLHNAKKVISAIDARMGEIYQGRFQDVNGLVQELTAESVVQPEVLVNQDESDWYGVGTGWGEYKGQLDPNDQVSVLQDVLYPSAEYMLPIVRNSLSKGLAVPVEQAQPVYLRDKVTWKKLPGRE